MTHPSIFHQGREEFQGAAGKKSLGEVARPEGLKTNVAHAVSQVDEAPDRDFRSPNLSAFKFLGSMLFL